ncbi:MAG TPA: shikimate kinase [Candidatus Dormibacteraeota bacterium]|nr:shikimate kinase [Candidatus Dormibacteraeota bacterium]
MGSGKTLVGALVAQRSHAAFFDLDHLVEDLAGMSIAEVFATSGEQAFRALEQEALPRTLASDTVVALGGGTAMNDDNWELISSRATTVYLEVPFEMLWARIHTQHHRPLVSGRTEAQVRELYDTRRARYELAAHRVDGNRQAGEVADEVIKLWSA